MVRQRCASFSLGGLQALDPVRDDDSGFDTFVDLVGRAELGELTAILDGNFVLTRGGAPDGSDRHLHGDAWFETVVGVVVTTAP